MTMRQFTLLGLVVLVSVLVWGWSVTRPTAVAEVVAFPRGGPTPDARYWITMQGDTLYIVDTTTWQEHTQIWSDSSKTAYLPHSKGLLLFDHFQLRLIRPAADGTLQTTTIPIGFASVGNITVSPDEQYAVLTNAGGSGSQFGELFGPYPPSPVQMALVRLEDGQIVQWFREPPGPGAHKGRYGREEHRKWNTHETSGIIVGTSISRDTGG